MIIQAYPYAVALPAGIALYGDFATPRGVVHTHFVTDCVRLSHTQGRKIEAALLPVLRQHHLVYYGDALTGYGNGMMIRD